MMKVTCAGRLAAAVLIWGLAAGAAQAQAGDRDGILTLQFENDFFGSSDSHFTHGTRFAWMSAEDDVPGWVKDAAKNMPMFDADASRRIVWSLGQSMFTPDDLSAKELIVEDRPYAGWLYAGVGLVSVSGNRLDNLQLDLGVVGPASGAEDFQRAWHKAFGFPKPQGWDNQLRNEPGIMLTYERTWRQWRSFPLLGLDGDIAPHVGANLGNVLTQGAAGFMVRIGDDLSRHYDYGPPRIRPSMPGSDYFIARRGFGWYLFFGAEARVVGRNIFLDGNTFSDSHSVDKKIFVGDVQAGIAFVVDGVRLAYTHVLRSKEFDGQDSPDQFGSISLSLQF